MHQKLKLIHHKHSGKPRPHEHTSYGALLLILFVTGAVLAAYTYSTQASSNLTGPHSESISLTGAMPEPPPDTAATITSPDNQQSFNTSPITVEGTCPEDSLVEILKNNVFAGSTLCEDDGTFSLEIDLFIGENDLIARVYNALNQPGPNSEVITVFYDALPLQEAPLSTVDFTREQLLLNTDPVYRGTFVNETFTMPVEVIGGTPPFAIDVRWGDNENEVVPRENNQPFNISHIYTRPGTYQVNLQATDNEGRVAFLTTVVIINGELPATPDTEETDDRSWFMSLLRVQWPIFAATLGMVLSFWMGELREKRILTNRGLLPNNRDQ